MHRSPSMNSLWLAQKERGSRRAMRLMKWLALRCGRRAARLMLYPVCAYFIVFSPRARRASGQYLARALGRPPRLRDVWRHYFTFAATVLDRIFLLGGQIDRFNIELTGVESLHRTLAEGRGCLLLGAHLGSFEVLRATGLLQRKLPISVVMYEDNAAIVSEVLNGLHPEIRSRIIVPGRIDTMLRISDCFARGEIVGMLGDRCAGSEKTVTCPFFGEDAAFPQGPLLLAWSLRVPVVLFAGLYEGDARYVIHFEPFCDRPRPDRAARAGWVQQGAIRYAARLEHFCRTAPYNWFNFYDFWSRSPG